MTAYHTAVSGVGSVTVDFSGQAVFEVGVVLFECLFHRHPLGNYPDDPTTQRDWVTVTASEHDAVTGDDCVCGQLKRH